MQLADYKYDVFLSWTGKDAQLKNTVKLRLENAGFSCYDSELDCNGVFRDNYVQALQASKVYLILMTDNLRNNPNESGKGTFTEVRKEFSLALDLEAHGDLNVELLNFSEFFCYKEVYRDLSDQLGWFFYVNTRGYSRLDALDGLTESVFSKLISDVGHFVNCRNKQRPVLSQKPKLGVEVFPVANCVDFYGREMELLQISNAFLQGAKVVALYGMDGMGKLSIARRFAQACNDSETFVCAQIVRVQNKDYREQGGVYPSVVSSVAYSDGAISRYASDVEKQAQKERVLFNLPDFVLLVVDNVSELTLDDVNLFLRLNCKVLITTRVKPDFEVENFKAVEVGSLPLTDAYAMFCKLSQQKEQDVSKEKFSQLYNVVGGHTMTLCLVAKAAKKHKKSVEEMLQEFETTGEFSENVSHKDSADKICEETISAHLQKLFGLQNQIDKDGESVLRNLSLIAEGKMPCKLLCEQLGFFNRNAVLELERSGWASLDEKDFLCLHPLVSQLANNLLAPTSKNAAVAVQYVVSNAQNRNVTYGDVGLAFDGLFFALFRIAKNEKKLCNVLWEEFEKASLLVSDFEKLQICCRKLADVLKGFDDPGAKKVQLFVDANSIERYPTKLEVLSSYLPTLATSADDYKFVMRALSITSDFFVESAQSRATLLNVLHKALLAAAEKDDGLAVCSLATSYLMLGGKDVEAKVVQKFLKNHKNDGSALFLQYVFASKRLLGENMLQASFDILGDETGREGNRAVLRHPLAYCKLCSVMKKAEKIPQEDEMSVYWDAMLFLSEQVAENGEIPLESLVQKLQRCYVLQVENKITLQAFHQMLQTLFVLVKRMPVQLQSSLKTMVDVRFDAQNFTMEQVANLRLAYEVNNVLQDPQSMRIAFDILRAERKMHSNDHVDVVNARLKLASACALFGKEQDAIYQYMAAYDVLKITAPNSTKLFETCNAMLSLMAGYASWKSSKKIAPFRIEEILQVALSCCLPYSANALEAQINYVKFFAQYLQMEKYKKRCFDKLQEIVCDFEKYAKNNVWARVRVLGCIQHVAIWAANGRLSGVVAETLEILESFASKRCLTRDEKLKSKLVLLATQGYAEYHNGNLEGARTFFNKAMAFGVKHNLNTFGSTAISLQFTFSSFAKECDDMQTFVRRFLGCDKLSKKQIQIVDFVNNYVQLERKIDVQDFDSDDENLTDYCNYLTKETCVCKIFHRFGQDFCNAKLSENFNVSLKQCKTVAQYKLSLLENVFYELYAFSEKGQVWQISLCTLANGDVGWRAILSHSSLRYEFLLHQA